MVKERKLILFHTGSNDDLNDAIFNSKKGLNDCEKNRLNCLDMPKLYNELKKFLHENGYDFHTIDMFDLNKADIIIFLDVNHFDPYFKKIKKGIKKHTIKARICAWFIESPLIKPHQYKQRVLRLFDRVLTMNTSLVDNKKFFKYYFPEIMIKKNSFKIKFNKHTLYKLVYLKIYSKSTI